MDGELKSYTIEPAFLNYINYGQYRLMVQTGRYKIFLVCPSPSDTGLVMIRNPLISHIILPAVLSFHFDQSHCFPLLARERSNLNHLQAKEGLQQQERERTLFSSSSAAKKKNSSFDSSFDLEFDHSKL